MCWTLHHGPRKLLQVCQSNFAFETGTSSSIQHIQCWHQRLGHPSFGMMKKILPNLVKRCNRDDFVCDICECAKHKRVSHPISDNKCKIPFMVIHSDVCGPYAWIANMLDIDGLSFLLIVSRTTGAYLMQNKVIFTC